MGRENTALSGLNACRLGTSPRVRGDGIQPSNHWVTVGITSADAERKPPWLRCSRQDKEYPRGCRDDSASIAACVKLLG